MEVSGFITGEAPATVPAANEWEVQVAQGGTSVCYKCRTDGRLYFKKSLRSEFLDEIRYRDAYRKEYSLGVIIDNPYIVKYHRIIDAPEECSLLLDYVDGQNVKELLAANPHYFDRRTQLDTFVRQLLQAMRYMHQRQIVHMDLNPTNVMVSRTSGDVKVVDLGFSYSDSYQDTPGTTKAYSASEAQDGSSALDVRTDIYGFGCILQYIQDNSSLSLSSAYKRVMDKCLSEDKAGRYASVDEIMDDLFSMSRRTKLIASAAVLLLLAIPFFAFDAPRHIRHALFGYDFADNEGVLYSILDQDSMTCSVVGYDISHDERRHHNYGRVIVPEVATYKDAHYRVVEIADSAFCTDSVVTMVSVMPKKIVVGKSSFGHTKNLRYVTFAGEAEWHAEAFYCAIGLTGIDFPKNLRAIPYLCFYENLALKHLSLPEGITAINQDAYAACWYLVDAHLPSTLQSLGRGVFYACPRLEEVSIPAATRDIGMFCFMECPNLKRIYNHAPTPQKVTSLFDKDKKIKVYVPRESVEKYRQAECWKEQEILPID